MRICLLLISIGLCMAAGQPKPVPVQYSGSPAVKLDVEFLGDGFTHEEMGRYRQIVNGFKDAVLGLPPFCDFRGAFNFWRVDVESPKSGISTPSAPVNTALGVTYDGDREFYSDNEAMIGTLARGAGFIPELIVVIANDKKHYGGAERAGFVYVSLDPSGKEVLQHEIGHSFCIDQAQANCINDEYTEKAFETFAVQTEDYALLPPNLVPPNAAPPLCTPRSWCSILTCAPDPPDNVGCYVGGMYYGLGVYHSGRDCKMKMIESGFCPVCSRVIRRILSSYATNGETSFPLVTSRPASGILAHARMSNPRRPPRAESAVNR